MLLAGLAMVLLTSACDSSPTETATHAVATPTATRTLTPRATASASATGSPGPSGTPSSPTAVVDGIEYARFGPAEDVPAALTPAGSAGGVDLLRERGRGPAPVLYSAEASGSYARWYPAVVQAAIADLAAHNPVDAAAISVVSVRYVDWPDSCLGVEQQGVSCAQVITPGFLVELFAAGTTYEYHTDVASRVVPAS